MKSVTDKKCSNLIFLGFLGFLGIRDLTGEPLLYLYIGFFANFVNIWWVKLGRYHDERINNIKQKAGTIALYTGFVLAGILTILIRLSSVDLLMLYKLQVLIFPATFAIAINLWGVLTYILSRKYLK